MDKKTALIIDDEQDILEHVGAMLSSYGFKVLSSLSGREGLKLATENKPDIIILDINIPDIDGGEIANQLSQNHNTCEIPIVYLTGLITKEERKEPEKIGKNFVIAKPILKGELLSIVSKVLK